MFKDFVEEYIEGDGANLFVRRSGPKNAEPIVLLHGYPQTSAMWHAVAEKPISDASHYPYSKRAMAKDIVAMMKRLGHNKFLVGAHDRGARVAHRLGLDYPDCIEAMVLLDIAPTREMYAGTSANFAQVYWHWFFLTQPNPLPEKMIS